MALIGREMKGRPKLLFLASCLASLVFGLTEYTMHLASSSDMNWVVASLDGLHVYAYRLGFAAVLAAFAVVLALWIKADRKLVKPLYALGFWLISISIWVASFFAGKALDGHGWITPDHPLCYMFGYLPWPTVTPLFFLYGPLILIIARWLDLELSRRAYVTII
ncbi:MAG: hypothetical protein DRJ98_02985 [Thermoprotei archaeon]|nr:MAG: hypothetical protein DRJ98_02985 [Thermoprotei archaeon]